MGLIPSQGTKVRNASQRGRKKKKKKCYGVDPHCAQLGSAPPRTPEGRASAGGIGLLVSALLVEGCPLDAKSLHPLLGMARSSLPGRELRGEG